MGAFWVTDQLIKAVSKDKAFRLLAVSAKDLVQQAQSQQKTWPTATAALGRTLVGTLLLSSAILKDQEKLTVRIAGNGPLGPIIADGNAQDTVRGYVTNPEVNLPPKKPGKLDVQAAVGRKGMLVVSKDLGLKRPFVSQVPLASGEIAADFTYYLAKSEQIPSSMGLSVFVEPDGKVGAAGGFLIQTLPGASNQQLDQLEHQIAQMPALSTLLRQGQTPTAILSQLFQPSGIKVLAKEQIAYHCECSKARFAKSLAALPQSQLREMVQEQKTIETVCKFCGRRYHFTLQELQAMLKTN